MNPYSTPESKQVSAHSPLNTELRNIVIGWERMRVLYNILLFLVGITAIFFCMKAPFFKLEDAVFPAILFGIFANICFCAGPIVETYIRVIFNSQDVRTLRLSLFISGTLLSLVPAFFTIATSGAFLNFSGI